MEKTSKIFVAGFDEMVTATILETLGKQGYENRYSNLQGAVDLGRQKDVEDFFKAEKPDYVFFAATMAGGVAENQEQLADFFYKNMVAEMNVIHSAWQNGCKRLLFVGSSSVYPRMVLQPEEGVQVEELEKTKEANALAKFSGLKYCEFLNRQYGTNYISVVPTNVYGPNDNYHSQHGHVLPSFIRKFHDAVICQKSEVVCWGTGTPLRDFLYVEDLADACIFLMQNYEESGTINIGTGRETSIRELAELVAETVGYRGKIIWDTEQPDGMPRIALDLSKINQTGWHYSMTLEEGIKHTYNAYLEEL